MATQLRKCIGSARYGIEAHEAPADTFPKQPSQKDGLGRMCRTHWNQYTAGLARDAKARKAAEPGQTPGAADLQHEREVDQAAKALRLSPPAAEQVEEVLNGLERQSVEIAELDRELAKVGPESDAGQALLEQAAQASAAARRAVNAERMRNARAAKKARKVAVA